MQLRNYSRAARLVPFLIVCCHAYSICLGAEQDDLARHILVDTRVRGGLVVHVGCGDGKLTAALHASDAYVVQGLDTRAARIEAARQYIRLHGLCGKVSVTQWSGRRLPYIDNLVNLVVAEDLGQVSMDEVLRVLAPSGVAYVKENGRWEKTVKPWPGEIDQWTHHLYDSTGINAGNDCGIGPPRHLQWEAGPQFSRSHENMSSVSAVVSSGGRVFSIMDEGPLASIYLPGKWYLTARDAFSGVLLWKKPIESWHARLFPLKSGPVQLLRRLVAADDYVYVTLALDAPVSKLDAATGKVLATYRDTQHAEEILHVDGKLVVVSSNSGNTTPFQGRMPAYRPDLGIEERVLAVRSEKTVTVIDAGSDRTLWRLDCGGLVPLTVVADEKRLCFLAAAQAKCLALNTGATIWERKLAEERPRTTTFHSPTVLLHEDLLYVAIGGTLNALDAASGDPLWTARCAGAGYRVPASIFILNNLIWDVDTSSEPYRPGFKRIPGRANRTFVGYDLRTGEIRKELPIYDEQGYGVMHHRCHMPRASGDYILTGFPGIELIDTNSGEVKHHSWIRGACVYGFMPANGLIYTPPHPCACYMQAKLSGFLAVAPARRNPEPKPDPTDKQTKLVRGPAFGKTGPEHVQGSESWPTYRGDAARSGRYAGALPTTLKLAWKTQLAGRLTQPVISQRRLFTVSTDHHELHAMDADSGELLWSYNPGGKVDSAPTCYKGMVILGCRDGYVYNLRASDGELVWRFRAAPTDSRLVSYNQVESVWPVHGSVLIQDDVLWFVAGRSSFLDGGLFVYRLDPETGTQLSVTKVFMIGEDGSQPPVLADAIQPTDIGGRMATRLDMEGAKPDVLSCDGRRVFMRHYTFDLQGRSTDQNIDHLFSPTGFLDDSWFRRTYWLYGSHYVGGAQGWAWAGNSRPSGRIMSIGVDSIYGFGRDKYPPSPGNAHQMYAAGEKEFLFRVKRDRVAGETDGKRASGRRSQDGKRAKAVTYEWSVAADLQLRAMLLADNDKMLLFVAGARGDWITSQDAYEGKLGSTLRVVSTSDGKTISQYALSSPPRFDGISAAAGKLYIAMQDGSIQCWSGRLTDTVGPSCAASQPSKPRQTRVLGPIDVVASPDGKTLYVACADAKQVASVNAHDGTVLRSIEMPAEPTGLVLSGDGATLYVSCAAPEGCVCPVSVASGEVGPSIPVGHGAIGPAISPDGKTLYACNRFDNNVAAVDLTTGRITLVPTTREPYAAAVTPDGKSVFVINHLPLDRADGDDVASVVTVIDTATNGTQTIRLPNGSTAVRGICVSPDGKYVYATHLLARYQMPTTQVERGWMNTNSLSIIDARRKKLINTVLLDEVDLGAANPWGVACTADGKMIVVCHAGTHEVSVIDATAMLEKLLAMPKERDADADKAGVDSWATAADVPNDLAFLVGLRRRVPLSDGDPIVKGPRGLAVVGSKAFAAAYFTDTLSAVDLEPKPGNPEPSDLVSTIALGPVPRMSLERRGEMLFNDATLCFQHWQSCASCHPDARDDALNWDLLGSGMGNPQNTRSMVLAHRTPPSMSSGIRSNAKVAVRGNALHLLFGRHVEENAVAIDKCLESLKPVPSPYLVDGKLSPAAQRGKKLFFDAKINCAKCHPEPLFTDMLMHDVGSRGKYDQRDTFDTPTLIECWRTAPYMHDGRYTTLKDLFAKGKHGLRGGNVGKLSDQKIKDLVEYVLSL